MAYFGTVAAHNILVHRGRGRQGCRCVDSWEFRCAFESVKLCLREAATSMLGVSKRKCVFPSRQGFRPGACVLGTLLKFANRRSLTL